MWSIMVNDVNGVARTAGAIYALISHGPNGHGAYSKKGTVVSAGSVNANELVNCHCNSSGTPHLREKYVTYVQATPPPIPAIPYSFDDIVMYKEYWQTQTNAYPLPPPKMFAVYLNTPLRLCADVYQLWRLYLPRQLRVYGTSGNGGLNNAQGVAVDAGGNVWVAEWGGLGYEFNGSGNFISQIGTSGYTNGKLRTPWGVAIDNGGNIWVTETVTTGCSNSPTVAHGCRRFPPAAVAMFRPAGCTASATNGQFNTPMGIAIDSGSNIWVADSGNNRIEKFSSIGDLPRFDWSGLQRCKRSHWLLWPRQRAVQPPEWHRHRLQQQYLGGRLQQQPGAGAQQQRQLLNGIGKGYNGLSGSIGTSGLGKGQFTHSRLRLPLLPAVWSLQ